MKRCFITGQQCTHQNDIARIRHKNFENGCASAFVVMSFEKMTDVTFNSVIRPEMDKYAKANLLLKKADAGHVLICCEDDRDIKTYRELEAGTKEKIEDGKRRAQDVKLVKRIIVNRADQKAAFGYIICNQICQQIQVADIVIVDVSKDNPNVFYEFGLSMALGKFIIPVCFKNDYEKEESDEGSGEAWRKKLYEYFSIGEEDMRKRYNESELTSPDARRYSMSELHLGQTMLQYDDGGFIDTDVAKVIVNYAKFVKRLENGNIFKGDRIAVLVQQGPIYAKNKENPNRRPTEHSFPAFLLNGVNVAAGKAEDKVIKPLDQVLEGDTERFLNDYHKHRGFLFHTRNSLNEGASADTRDITVRELRGGGELLPPFEMMIEALGYANQIVVDTDKNDVVALFWLGVAHGFGAYAVRIMREYTDYEKEQEKLHAESQRKTAGAADKGKREKPNAENQRKTAGAADSKPRNVIDLSGLWAAYINSDEYGESERQLETVQLGIASHRKLLPIIVEKDAFPNRNNAKDEEADNYSSYESYYRRRMWSALLSHDRLHIILGADPKADSSVKEDRTPRLKVGDWDHQAVSLLTEYSSAHNTVDKYLIRAFENKREKKGYAYYRDALGCDNVICVGDNTVNPVSHGIIGDIYQSCDADCLHYRDDIVKPACGEDGKAYSERAFLRWPKGAEPAPGDLVVKWRQPTAYCTSCKLQAIDPEACEFKRAENMRRYPPIAVGDGGYNSHISYAQLLIVKKRRDGDTNGGRKEYFEIVVGGGAGPATFALSSLFVNEEIKYKRQTDPESRLEEIFDASVFDDKDGYLLVKLQTEIRRRMLEEFRSSGYIKGISNGNLEKIKEYMRLLLSRYFLPMLYQEDIEGIVKSVKYFVYKVINEDPGIEPLNKEARKRLDWNDYIEKAVRNAIESYVGTEVIFKVEVSHKISDGGQTGVQGVEDRAVRRMSIAEYGISADGNKCVISDEIEPDDKAKYSIKPAVFMIRKRV
ncbi:MAG: hypothetical protein FWC55_06890 [Firmicutes bacterium]|nr:hypothetical protein [Bacillota bacterium]